MSDFIINNEGSIKRETYNLSDEKLNIIPTPTFNLNDTDNIKIFNSNLSKSAALKEFFLNSINALTPEVIIYICITDLKIDLRDIKYRESIVQQIYGTLYGISIGYPPTYNILKYKNENLLIFESHLNAVKMAVLAHLIDDIFDIYDNHKDIRDEILNILDPLIQLNKIKKIDLINDESDQTAILTALDKIIEIITKKPYLTSKSGKPIKIEKEVIQQLIAQIKIEKQKFWFKNSILQMIIDGLIQTTNEHSLAIGKNVDYAWEQQHNLASLFGGITFINEDYLNMNSVIPLRIKTSKTSSLQIMFQVFQNDPLLDPYKIELVDYILGAVVRSLNVKNEIKDGRIVYFDEIALRINNRNLMLEYAIVFEAIKEKLDFIIEDEKNLIKSGNILLSSQLNQLTILYYLISSHKAFLQRNNEGKLIDHNPVGNLYELLHSVLLPILLANVELSNGKVVKLVNLQYCSSIARQFQVLKENI